MYIVSLLPSWDESTAGTSWNESTAGTAGLSEHHETSPQPVRRDSLNIMKRVHSRSGGTSSLLPLELPLGIYHVCILQAIGYITFFENNEKELNLSNGTDDLETRSRPLSRWPRALQKNINALEIETTNAFETTSSVLTIKQVTTLRSDVLSSKQQQEIGDITTNRNRNLMAQTGRAVFPVLVRKGSGVSSVWA